MKKLDIFVVLTASFLMALPQMSLAQFTFTTNNGAITITGYTGFGGSVVIPSATNGYPVVAIGTNAFHYKYAVTSVTIPDSIANIQYEAFSLCYNLTNVTIGANVKLIGDWAFTDCGLISLSIPGSVTNIGNYAFSLCNNLGSLTIGNGVTSIGFDAFEGCNYLLTVTIPGNVLRIGQFAFSSCTNLHSAYFLGNAPVVSSTVNTNSVAGSADSTVFNGESGTVSFQQGTTGWGISFGGWQTAVAPPFTSATDFEYFTNNGTITINGYTGSDGDVNIPNTISGYPVTDIADFAFYNCTYLTSAVIPNSVSIIGNQVFNSCFGLTNITIGNGVTSIGDSAFEETALTSIIVPNNTTNISTSAFTYCYALTNITVAVANPTYASSGGVLFNKNLNTLLVCPRGLNGTYTVPNSVNDIGGLAFFNCVYLTSITLPNTITNIDGNAFASCFALTNINIPNSVSNIGYGIFSDCGALKSITIPNSICSIGADAFSGAGLTTVTIPSSVTNVGNTAFLYCGYLTNITVGADNIYYASVGGVLFDKNVSTLICCPEALSSNMYIIPSSVKEIANSAFRLCEELTNVVIPNGVTSIDDYAFVDTGLISITIPGSVTNIGSYAFYYSSLHQAYFQGSAPSVDGLAGIFDETVFTGDVGTAYYLQGAAGWGSVYGGWYTAYWLPQITIMSSKQSLQTQGRSYIFDVSWGTNTSVVIQASTNLVNWTPILTNALVNGTLQYTDAASASFPRRFYRIRSN